MTTYTVNRYQNMGECAFRTIEADSPIEALAIGRRMWEEDSGNFKTEITDAETPEWSVEAGYGGMVLVEGQFGDDDDSDVDYRTAGEIEYDSWFGGTST